MRTLWSLPFSLLPSPSSPPSFSSLTLSSADNPEHPVYFRTTAARRWTILPTTTYADIVVLFDKVSKPHKDSVGNAIKPWDKTILEVFFQIESFEFLNF
jgi:hypothetical protein